MDLPEGARRHELLAGTPLGPDAWPRAQRPAAADAKPLPYHGARIVPRLLSTFGGFAASTDCPSLSGSMSPPVARRAFVGRHASLDTTRSHELRSEPLHWTAETTVTRAGAPPPRLADPRSTSSASDAAPQDGQHLPARSSGSAVMTKPQVCRRQGRRPTRCRCSESRVPAQR